MPDGQRGNLVQNPASQFNVGRRVLPERGIEQRQPGFIGLCPLASLAGQSNRGNRRLVKWPERIAADEIEPKLDDVAFAGWKLREGPGFRHGADNARRGAEHEVAEACLSTDHWLAW